MEVNKIISYKFFANSLIDVNNRGSTDSNEFCIAFRNNKDAEKQGATESLFVFMNCDIATNIYMALKGYFED